MSDLNYPIKIFGEASGSIVDGPGIRYAIFVQGCPHRCEGCHNRDSWDFDAGRLTTIDKIYHNILNSKSCCGVTLSGGEPFCQTTALISLCSKLKESNYNIWCYTGFLFEKLLEDKESTELLNYVDVLVDGLFKKKLKSMDCLYRGSTNQRLIDVNKSLKCNRVVPWIEEYCIPQKPMSW